MLEDDKGGPGPHTGGSDTFPNPIRPIVGTEGADPNGTLDIGILALDGDLADNATIRVQAPGLTPSQGVMWNERIHRSNPEPIVDEFPEPILPVILAAEPPKIGQ